MVLVGYITALKIFDPSKFKNFNNELKVSNNADEHEYKKSVLTTMLSFSVLVIILMLSVIPAMIIAYSCNTGNERIIPLIVAFFFSDIYMCNYAIRKFIFKDPSYSNL
tara:strand:- start:863 stop:1186 length:324 start_codon:yes stop_codon:yes gene_type:complete